MRKTFLTMFLILFSAPSLACDCHGVGFGFAGFVGRQMPAQDCIPEHISMVNGEVGFGTEARSAADESIEKSGEEGSETDSSEN